MDNSQQVSILEQRLAVAEDAINKLITQFLPPVTERLKNLEQAVLALQAAPAPAAAPAIEKKRKAMTADMYDTIKHWADAGKTEKEIAEQLSVPYTTVRAYLRLTQERIAALYAKRDKAKAQESKKKASQQVSPQPQEAAPTQPSAPVDDIVEADYTETPQQCFQVECAQSPEPFGGAGWWEWSEDNKRFALTNQQADGYPCYYPVDRNTMITVQYMNEQVQKGIMSQDVDWTPDGGVLRWKIASL